MVAMINRVIFKSTKPDYMTPDWLYKELNKEFNFNDDPCPFDEQAHALYPNDGLARTWGTSTFVNPPYGKETIKWLRKAYEESTLGKTIVCLIASRTDTKWWHDYCMKATEIRFIRGRLKFENSQYSAPFPSAIVIFNGGYK